MMQQEDPELTLPHGHNKVNSHIRTTNSENILKTGRIYFSLLNQRRPYHKKGNRGKDAVRNQPPRETNYKLEGPHTRHQRLGVGGELVLGR